MIDKLDYLIALARHRHFGRAAEACGVTQPTLSAGLKQLERSLGVLLVQRGARFRGFTPEGERALAWALRIVGDVRQMRQEAASRSDRLAGHLRLAVIPTALPMVARITTPYRTLHPDVRFTILSRTSADIVALIEGLEVDAGLSYLNEQPLGRLRAEPLYRERYCLLIAADHPLSTRSSVAWAELGEVPLCLLTDDMQNRRILDRRLAEAGTRAQATLESNSLLALVAHVRTGRWASIMPTVLAETFDLTASVRALPIIRPEATHEVGLILPERDPLPAMTAALLAVAGRLDWGKDD